MSELEYSIIGDGEIDALAAVLSQSFHFPADESKKFIARAGDQARVVHLGDEVVAGLVIHDMEQFWGGRGMPMGAIAAVGVAPHVRAKGVGKLLMSETVRELRGRGVPITTLYASTEYLYRSVGYEQAGNFFRYQAPTRSVPRFASDLEVHSIEPSDSDLMKSITDRAGRPNGFARRDDLLWKHLADPDEDRAFAYVVGPREDPEGYVLFLQSRGEGGFVLHAKDFVALTRAARERIWTLISDHRSLGRTCRFDGGATSDHLILFPEQEYRIHDFERWMLRITDVPAALTARGWPSHADAELHLQVTDDVVPENDGRWVLRVSGGEASVEKGGEGSLKLSVGMLAPLYTGLHSASTLEDLGRLEGADAAIATADEVFAGPEPVMTERF